MASANPWVIFVTLLLVGLLALAVWGMIQSPEFQKGIEPITLPQSSQPTAIVVGNVDPNIVRVLNTTVAYVYNDGSGARVADSEFIDPEDVVLGLEYNVDVFYNSAGVLGEGGSNALRCQEQNGSDYAYSQHGTRFVHLISFCGNSMYDVTIARIVKAAPRWKNFWSQLIGAYEVELPEALLNASNADKAAWWFGTLQTKWPGIAIRLSFLPGEIKFILRD